MERRRPGRRGEWLLKPLVLVALIAAAWGMGAGDTAAGRWVLAALVLSLLGDIALLSESEPRFVAGLSAFLLAHVAYVVAFALTGMPAARLALVGAALVVLAGVTVGRRVIPAAAREGGAALGGACAAYLLVIGTMVVTAWATGRPLVALGATVFMTSDAILAWNRFVAPLRHGHVAVMVTYHVGQALIVIGLLR
ncbi:putative membrane protein YhhN [Knoellia remsis]|uniref:Putative membrane protein YhhN n=1 Tax=Knoellia remsis TaxID=407159 RepID=A0A2T0U893_9MICO|nr:lysoplasmalogenase [Knoellia remsis]PRY54143.1 putative membrane protein YhhN [Knoellia remsis]